MNENKLIMETLTIEITNPNALGLLVDLENLHFIKVLKRETIQKPKLSTILRGTISAEAANLFNESITKSRLEWDRNI